MKKFTSIMLALLMPTLIMLTACGSTDDKQEKPSSDANKNEAADSGNDAASGKHHVEIVIRDYGTISAELNANAAPITVENFISLAKSGFYNGLTFHRIIKGFMMQGGDPLGNGRGGSNNNIKGEFALNGVDNPLSHTRGAISMARSQNYDSASSQFFICHEDSTFLDRQYACFGYVTNGIEVVDAVCEKAKPIDGNGTIAASEQPVIEKITVID